MKKIVGICLAFLLGIGLIGCSADANQYNALYYATSLKSAGFPIDNIIEYTEETDVNGLLGRPGEYISKVNFADTRIDQYDPEDPLGGTIEVFSSKGDMEKRKKYLEGFAEESSLLGGYYIYVSPDNLAIMRIDYDLTPTQADEYNNAFIEISETGEATPVAIETKSENVSEETESPMPTTPSAEAKPSGTVPAVAADPIMDSGDMTPQDLKDDIFVNMATYEALSEDDPSDSLSNNILDIAIITDVIEDPADPRHFTFSYENSRFDIFTDENGIAQMCCVTVGKSDHYALMAPAVLSSFEPDHLADAFDVILDLGEKYIASDDTSVTEAVGNTLLSLSVVDDELFYILINHDAMSLDQDYYMDQVISLL